MIFLIWKYNFPFLSVIPLAYSLCKCRGGEEGGKNIALLELQIFYYYFCPLLSHLFLFWRKMKKLKKKSKKKELLTCHYLNVINHKTRSYFWIPNRNVQTMKILSLNGNEATYCVIRIYTRILYIKYIPKRHFASCSHVYALSFSYYTIKTRARGWMAR